MDLLLTIIGEKVNRRVCDHSNGTILDKYGI